MGDLTEFEMTKMCHFVGSLRRTRVMAWMRASPEADRQKAPRLAEACKHCTVAYQKEGKALPAMFTHLVFDSLALGQARSGGLLS